MSPPVALRWKLLIVIGLAVLAVDQWTKFLAVKHLTPGIAMTHEEARRGMTPDERSTILAKQSLSTQLKAFYGEVRDPCHQPGARCPAVEVVPGFWNWRYVQNPGAAWGLLADASEKIRVPFFWVVSLAAIAFIVGFFRKLKDEQTLLVISLSLVFGGAIGNFIDRLHLSYVIDFIDWYVGDRHWPTFNFADAAITTGVALLMLEWLVDAIRGKSAEEASAAQAATVEETPAEDSAKPAQ